MLVINVLGVQGLLWFWQKRNALNELITIQYVIGTELQQKIEDMGLEKSVEMISVFGSIMKHRNVSANNGHNQSRFYPLPTLLG